jgi:hypothetical protein
MHELYSVGKVCDGVYIVRRVVWCWFRGRFVFCERDKPEACVRVASACENGNWSVTYVAGFGVVGERVPCIAEDGC